jgi:hypothetical protein
MIAVATKRLMIALDCDHLVQVGYELEALIVRGAPGWPDQFLSIEAVGDRDEFDIVGLGAHRFTEDW